MRKSSSPNIVIEIKNKTKKPKKRDQSHQMNRKERKKI